MAAFDLVRLALELVHPRFRLLELRDHGRLLVLELPGQAVFLLQPLLKVLRPDRDAVAFVSAQEGLGSDVSDGALDVVSGLNRIVKLALDVCNFLRLQLQPEVLLADLFILFIDSPDVGLNLLHVVPRLLKDRLAVLKVSLQALHIALDLSDLPLHVKDLVAELIRAALAHRASILGQGLLQLVLQLHHFALIERDLGPQILGLSLVALRHFAVGHFELALHVGILVVLGETALVQRARRHLLSEAPLHNIKLADLLADGVVLVPQVVAFALQVALHVCDVVIVHRAVVSDSRARLYQRFDPSELGLHHEDLLAQEVLFLLQSVVLALKFNYPVLLVGCRDGHALPSSIVAVLSRDAQVAVVGGPTGRRPLVCAFRGAGLTAGPLADIVAPGGDATRWAATRTAECGLRGKCISSWSLL